MFGTIPWWQYRTVRQIVAFSSFINTAIGGDGIWFVVNSNSTAPLFIEQFGYGLKIDHHGSLPIVIKDSSVKDYRSPLERACSSSWKMWDAGNDHPTRPTSVARQLNLEVARTKITHNGRSLWILGLKTKRAGTVVSMTTWKDGIARRLDLSGHIYTDDWRRISLNR